MQKSIMQKSIMQKSIMQTSIKLNKTFTHLLDNVNFDNIPQKIVNEIMKDGRPFSHFIEPWICLNYPLQHVKGCKSYDFTDYNFPETQYDEKTFTQRGCRYCPSNMLGQGRKFDKTIFEEKTKKLIFCIVSNINFPTIKIKFVEGTELLKKYPTGKIPLKDHDDFFKE